MKWEKLTLGKIIKIIEENPDIINPAYSEIDFEVVLGDDRLSIFIPTKFLKLPNRKYAEKIKRLFGADECNYIPKMTDDKLEKPFWSVEFKLKSKKLLKV